MEWISLVFAACALAATVASVFAWRSASRRARPAWVSITAGVVLWSVGVWLRLVWPAAPAALTVGPHLAGATGWLMGLLLLPRQTRTDTGGLRLRIDISITVIATVFLIWYVLLRPMAFTSGAIRGLVYPSAVFLVELMALALFLSCRPSGFPLPAVWLALGGGFAAVAEVGYATQAQEGLFFPGSALDLGWPLAALGLMAAAVSALSPARPPKSLWWERPLQALQAPMPLVVTIALGWVLLQDWQQTTLIDPLGAYVLLVLVMTLIVRQGILAGEVEFQQYAALVKSVAEPIFVCDRQGRLRLVNPALLEALGRQNEAELLGLPIQQVFFPSEVLGGALAQGLKGGWAGEVHLRVGVGVRRPVFLSLRPVLSGRGSRLALAGTAHDLTEIKRQQLALRQAYEQLTLAHAELEAMNSALEQRVLEKTADLSAAYGRLEQQNQELQTLDQLKSDFVSMVSHELRAPLTNINGGIELTLSAKSAVQPRARRTLELVQAEILRLNHFVETILDLSALDAGRAPIYPSPVALGPVFETMRRQFVHLPGADLVRWEAQPDLPVLLADERALGSILLHLVDNALKYAPGHLVTVKAWSEARWVFVAIEDEGAGIAEEALPLLFTRFYRSGGGDAQTVYGHGLGLHIVKRLLEVLGGDIQAENRTEGGARFTFWLPVFEAEHEGGSLGTDAARPDPKSHESVETGSGKV